MKHNFTQYTIAVVNIVLSKYILVLYSSLIAEDINGIVIQKIIQIKAYISGPFNNTTSFSFIIINMSTSKFPEPEHQCSYSRSNDGAPANYKEHGVERPKKLIHKS